MSNKCFATNVIALIVAYLNYVLIIFYASVPFIENMVEVTNFVEMQKTVFRTQLQLVS